LKPPRTGLKLQQMPLKKNRESGRQDLNLRPLDPQSSALAKLRHAPKNIILLYNNRPDKTFLPTKSPVLSGRNKKAIWKNYSTAKTACTGLGAPSSTPLFPGEQPPILIINRPGSKTLLPLSSIIDIISGVIVKTTVRCWPG
jgi:hypothetical protein